ncbi:MAG: hypothetical protein KGO02_25960 [Alphaproteobacteria bacterium]|nr:hypothetical protein [Alphaproteobacteria bacterium]
MRTILEAQIWPQAGAGDITALNAGLAASSKAKGTFIERALFYDRIAIPTTDFGILQILIHWLTLKGFRAAIDAGTLKFLRYGQLLAYVGNGGGILQAQLDPGPNQWPWQKQALHGTFDEAIELQIRHSPLVPDWERDTLLRAVAQVSNPIEINDDYFKTSISEETYKDILADPALLAILRRLYPGQKISLPKMPGVAPNQVRILSDHADAMNDGPLLALLVALLNVQILMSSSMENCDFSTYRHATSILRRKLERSGVLQVARLSPIKSVNIPGIPDIGGAVQEGRLDFSDCWKLSQSKNARRFREWLSLQAPSDTKDFQAAYLEMLRDEPAIAKAKPKLMR